MKAGDLVSITRFDCDDDGRGGVQIDSWITLRDMERALFTYDLPYETFYSSCAFPALGIYIESHAFRGHEGDKVVDLFAHRLLTDQGMRWFVCGEMGERFGVTSATLSAVSRT